MLRKINNYFYQFEIEKEGETPKDLLKIIFDNITNIKNRVGKDYDKNKIKVDITSIVRLSKNGEYRIIFQKGGYGYKTNFIEKDYDFSAIIDEKDEYGRDSGKTNSELEEIHYYSSLKINISNDEKYIKGIISIPRIRDGITSKEIGDLLRKLFTNIFTKEVKGKTIIGKGYYRNLRSVYSEGKVLEVFSNATEIGFIKDMEINGIVGKENEKETGKKMSKVKMSVTGLKDIEYWKKYIKEVFGKSTEQEIKQDLIALKHFKIKTKNGDFSLEGDDFKLHKMIEIDNYDNTLSVKDRTFFTNENINFINNTFSNFFKK